MGGFIKLQVSIPKEFDLVILGKIWESEVIIKYSTFLKFCNNEMSL